MERVPLDVTGAGQGVDHRVAMLTTRGREVLVCSSRGIPSTTVSPPAESDVGLLEVDVLPAHAATSSGSTGPSWGPAAARGGRGGGQHHQPDGDSAAAGAGDRGDRGRARGALRTASPRPSLAEVALALAAQDGSLLAERPELLERAATQVLARHPDAEADDVLLWAEAQLGEVAAVVPTSVRVEAGWDRTHPAAAAINRLRVVDHVGGGPHVRPRGDITRVAGDRPVRTVRVRRRTRSLRMT